ncbi:hydroxymethylbilane synthase activity protein [[Candida] boidinii]|nr:hydroxymethylbilane synthase activity protein [[Candida] boidinii]OWB76913.1 hydroxymethylbilane synthase activity protein [[Candida] boidinii]
MLSSPIQPSHPINYHSLQSTLSASVPSSASAAIKTKNKSTKTMTPVPSSDLKSSPAVKIQTEDNFNIPNNTLRIGSRKSKLAVKQSEIVGGVITKRFPQISTPIVTVSTLGDQFQNKPLYSFGGKALWTKELEILLLESVGEYEKIDLIVHSLKDMPTSLPDEFELGCILEREDPRDALVMKLDSPYKSLGDLPDGSVVGTSSVRRSAQLLKNFPHLQFKSVRGNINTRLSKLDDPEQGYDCIILAAAGLLRLNLDSRITQYLNEDIMYHAVGQGALGIEVRKNDPVLSKVCKEIIHFESAICCAAERSLLKFLEGGCSVPVGCKTTYNESNKTLELKAIVLSTDGKESVEDKLTATVESIKDAQELGVNLAKIMIENGAKKILDEINFDKINEIKQAGLTNQN